MAVLVTGGAGFIGSHVVRQLLNRGEEVICLDNFSPYYPPAVKERNIGEFLDDIGFSLIRGDIADVTVLHTVFSKYRITRIVHLAARAGVRASIDNPGIYFQTNVSGTLNILTHLVPENIENIVLISSSSVYGSDTPAPFMESAPCVSPTSPYAASKRSMELVAYTYHEVRNIPVSVIRPFTVYGPSGRPDMAPFLFTKAVDKGEPVVVFGDGTAQRDFTYIDDMVSGICSALDHPQPFEIYNIGCSHPRSVNELVAVIGSIMKKKPIIIHKPKRKEDMFATHADITKAASFLDYQPHMQLEDGMEQFIHWYKKNSQYYV